MKGLDVISNETSTMPDETIRKILPFTISKAAEFN